MYVYLSLDVQIPKTLQYADKHHLLHPAHLESGGGQSGRGGSRTFGGMDLGGSRRRR